MKTIVKKLLFVGVVIYFFFACSKAEQDYADTSLETEQSTASDLEMDQGKDVIDLSRLTQRVPPGLEPGEYWDREGNINGLQYHVCHKKDGRKWYWISIPLSRWKLKLGYQILENTDSANPTFKKMDIEDWNRIAWREPTLMKVNASFFNPVKNPFSSYGPLGSKAEVAHPIGEDNKVVSLGYDPREYGSRSLVVQGRKAYVISPSCISSQGVCSSFDLLVSGLDPAIDKRSTEKIGRVMIGIDSTTRPVINIFVTGSGSDGGATQAEAITVLRDYLLCDEILMLDGSASSNFCWRDKIVVKSSDALGTRNIPILLRAVRR
ncbi:MAG: hypothetical protein Q4B28_04745 [bacterium]|nr:hypothetical protein [bacterium]